MVVIGLALLLLAFVIVRFIVKMGNSKEKEGRPATGNGKSS